MKMVYEKIDNFGLDLDYQTVYEKNASRIRLHKFTFGFNNSRVDVKITVDGEVLIEENLWDYLALTNLTKPSNNGNGNSYSDIADLFEWSSNNYAFVPSEPIEIEQSFKVEMRRTQDPPNIALQFGILAWSKL
jgi:hypothetical protein